MPDAWMARAGEHRAHIMRTLPDAAIEHIGSTAIGGIRSKDVVDLLVGVPSDACSDATERLKSAGYLGCCGRVLRVWRLRDRRLDPGDKPPWSLRELAATFYVSPRSNPDFAWAFLSRFLLVTAYAFLVTFQAFLLLAQIGSPEEAVPRQVYLGTVAQSVDGYLVGMAIGGVGFGMYMAVDLALVADVLTDPFTAAKDLGVLNIAGASPFALAPAMAPSLLALGDDSYAVLYAVAGACALAGAAAVAPIKNVR